MAGVKGQGERGAYHGLACCMPLEPPCIQPIQNSNGIHHHAPATERPRFCGAITCWSLPVIRMDDDSKADRRPTKIERPATSGAPAVSLDDDGAADCVFGNAAKAIFPAIIEDES